MPEPDPSAAIRTPSDVTPASGGRPGDTSPFPVPDHTLIRRIGKGAYGEVWLARNALGTWRAVKFVHRSSFDDDRPFEREFAGIQRFEPISRSHESQLNILHVGRAADGFYYVMELADDMGRGQDIDEATYTPRNLRSELHLHGRLPVAECLRIGLALTTALEHLHKHGLVHRDIKPSNIIFVNGIPKLADIGLVARAEATMSFVGTEGFLPPEGPGTRQADIFSLGKVLYEISTGHDRNQFPELPTNIVELPDCAELSELNEVLLKACHRDPKERYQSAAEMHAELALLNSGESVLEKRQLARRLKLITRFAMAVVGILALGILPYFWAIRSAHQARTAAKQAATAAAKSQEVASFLKQMFESVRNSATSGQDTEMMKGILDRTKARVSEDLKDQPEVQADLLHTIGKIAFDLGEGREAVDDLSEALRLRRGLLGETNLLVAESLFWLGHAQELRGEEPNARRSMGQALAIRSQLLGAEHPETAKALSAYGTLIRSQPEAAEAAHREALRRLQSHYPDGHVDVAEALDNLGLTLKVRGKLAEGEQLARQSLDLWRRLTGNENPDVATALTRLGTLVQMQQRYAEAEPFLRGGYRQRRKFLGADHQWAAAALGGLTEALLSLGNFKEAERLIREHLAACKKKEANPNLEGMLITALAGQGLFPEARAVYHARAEQATKNASTATDHSNPDSLNNAAWRLATCSESSLRDGARALELAQVAVAASARTNASFLDTLAAAYAETGQFQQAVATQQEAMQVLESPAEKADYASRLKLYVAGQPYHEPGFQETVADSLAAITASLLRRGEFAEAEAPTRASLAFLQTESPNDWRTFRSQSELGGSLLGQKKHAEAEPLLLSGYEGLKQREEQIPPQKKSVLGETLQQLVQLYHATGRASEAAKWQAKLDELNRAAAEPAAEPEK